MAGAWGREQRAEAAAHIVAIARRLKVVVNFDEKTWEAHLSTRQVWIPEPSRPPLYLLALHEFGHIASTVAQQWDDHYSEIGPQALIEGAAWAWATREAKPSLMAWMQAEDWMEVAACMVSYHRYAASEKAPVRRVQAAI